ncbi:MAG: TRAP transporter permease [Dehalobacterium sp.]
MAWFKKKENAVVTEEGGSKRMLSGWQGQFITFVAVVMSVFHIYVLGYHSIAPYYLYNCHVTFAMVILYGLYVGRKTAGKDYISWIDWLIIIAALALGIYLYVNMRDIIYRVGVMPTQADLIFGTILLFLVLDGTRRTCGNILPILAIIFLLYAHFGNYIPGLLGHSGFNWKMIISFMMGMDAIYGVPVQASASVCFLFLVFGAFLTKSGAGNTFIDLAIGLTGRTRGGPAKVSIVASSLFGTISGNSVANVLTTGAFTIPMMKKIGYSSRFAGAVESVASTGGQIVPPIMGAAAFILASTLGIPYSRIMGAAVIPALLYYLAVFLMVDLEAVKTGLKGLGKEETPEVKQIIMKKWLHFLPIIVIILCLIVLHTSVIRGALWGITSVIVASLFFKEENMIKKPKMLYDSLSEGAKTSVGMVAACACAGIITGVLNLTGTGLKFAGAVMAISQGSLPIALILTMLVSLVLGMGLPTAAAYIITAAIASPALVNMGVSPLAAHMFCLYFACVSAITPPVALAAYAGAQLAKANPIQVGVTATKLGIVAFIVPYMFVYGEALLGSGSAGTIILAICSSCLGVVSLSMGLQGWTFNKVHVPVSARGCFICAAMLLIISGLATDMIGLAFLGAGIFLTLIDHKHLLKKYKRDISDPHCY